MDDEATEATDDEAISPEEMAELQAQAFAKPATASTVIVAQPAGDALAMQERVTRCDACGYTVEPEDGHICDRTGGRLVECHPFACAVKDCRVARRGTLLPSLSHHAQHLNWHLSEWEKEAKEKKASSALALAVASAVGPRAAAAAPTVDRWAAAGSLAVPGNGGGFAQLKAPAPNAVCVALLFSGADLTHLVGDCWQVGQAPLSAYVSRATPLLAVVPVDGMDPGLGGDVTVSNEGDANVRVRIGARWELRPSG